MFFSPVLMHIPDSFLSVPVSVVCWVITALALAVAVSKTNQALGEKQIPLMGVMAAFIFAAQMINFPILGGTSGHLLGGALAAIMLGPWAGMLVMTAVIAVQALLFQDGGMTVMGANILNMGLVTATIGYGIYRSTSNQPKPIKLFAAGVAAWLSVVAGATLSSFEIWLSGNAELKVILPAMLIVHALIGLGEATITVAALSFIMRMRPDLLDADSEAVKGGRGWIFVGVLTSLGVILLSPFASSNPDGLTRVAMNLGLISQSRPAPSALFSNYAIPFLGKTPFSTIGAGIIGTLVVGAIIFLIGRGMKAKS
jgi:cobalt/nickel transport system permease protein